MANPIKLAKQNWKIESTSKKTVFSNIPLRKNLDIKEDFDKNEEKFQWHEYRF